MNFCWLISSTTPSLFSFNTTPKYTHLWVLFGVLIYVNLAETNWIALFKCNGVQYLQNKKTTACIMKTIQYLLLLIFSIGLCSFTLKNTEKPKMYFYAYVFNEKGPDYTDDEKDYRTQILPASISEEVRKRIIKSKKATYKKEGRCVKPKKKVLYSEDRIIIYRLVFGNSSGTPFGIIYVKKISAKSSDIDKPVQFFIDKHLESHHDKNKFLKSENLYDKIPFSIKGKEKDFFEGFFDSIIKDMRDYMNESDSTEIKKSIEIEKKKATAIGVRG